MWNNQAYKKILFVQNKIIYFKKEMYSNNNNLRNPKILVLKVINIMTRFKWREKSQK